MPCERSSDTNAMLIQRLEQPRGGRCEGA